MLLLQPHSPTMCLVSQQWSPALYLSCCWSGFCPYLVLGHLCKPHVTPDLATLTDSAPYLGNDHLHVGDGKGLSISHIGYTMLRSPKHTFTLFNVLHVPHITKPLLSVQKFYRDNNVYFEFHASVFYVKDLTTKTMLLSGYSNDGLYVLFESSVTTIPQAYWSLCVSVTTNRWHRRLGHPTSYIFNLLVFKNKDAHLFNVKLVCLAGLRVCHCDLRVIKLLLPLI